MKKPDKAPDTSWVQMELIRDPYLAKIVELLRQIRDVLPRRLP